MEIGMINLKNRIKAECDWRVNKIINNDKSYMNLTRFTGMSSYRFSSRRSKHERVYTNVVYESLRYCPYCCIDFKDRDDLSDHLKILHLREQKYANNIFF